MACLKFRSVQKSWRPVPRLDEPPKHHPGKERGPSDRGGPFDSRHRLMDGRQENA